MKDFNEKENKLISEEDEWARMTPQKRWEESQRLFEQYVEMGGSLDPEPDSQSPFDFEEIQRAIPPYRRPGVHIIRRGRI